MRTRPLGVRIALSGDRSLWQITGPSAGAPTIRCQSAPAGAAKPAVASCSSRTRWPNAARSSSAYQLNCSPSTHVSTSRPRSSMPRLLGAPANLADSRWRNKACTAGVHDPAARRTLSPTRTTSVSPPPSSGVSSSGSLATPSSSPCDNRPSSQNPLLCPRTGTRQRRPLIDPRALGGIVPFIAQDSRTRQLVARRYQAAAGGS